MPEHYSPAHAASGRSDAAAALTPGKSAEDTQQKLLQLIAGAEPHSKVRHDTTIIVFAGFEWQLYIQWLHKAALLQPTHEASVAAARLRVRLLLN
jgi:hypothetical protein